MARENQGLQIALILFVMFTLIFGVTTFIFYKQYDEANTKAATAAQETAKAKQDLAAAQDWINDLKRILGFGATDKRDVINQEANKDMQVAAASLPEVDRVYRKVVQYLNDTVQKKNQALALAEAEKQQLQKQLADRERDANQRIKQHQDEVQKTGADLAQVTAGYAKQRDEIKSVQDQLVTERKKIADEAAEKEAALQKSLTEEQKKAKYTREVAIRYRSENEALTKESFEVALGKVQWANQKTGRVFINLGDADGLRRLTSFGVFAANVTDIAKAEKKASIEVVDIMGPHLAEARITDDKPGNPIVPGDVIYTPIWRPGKLIHFALAGLLDLDGDGRSDLDRVRNIIAVNGAVVDAYQEPSGKIVGKITPETNYLVKGIPPDEKSSRDFRKGFTGMIDEARANLVKEIRLEELLDRMGYRDTNRVTKFGPGSNPLDFRAKPPEGGLPVSSGTVSPLFKPRQPPRGGKTEY
jgi:hypothetical protein